MKHLSPNILKFVDCRRDLNFQCKGQVFKSLFLYLGDQSLYWETLKIRWSRSCVCFCQPRLAKGIVFLFNQSNMWMITFKHWSWLTLVYVAQTVPICITLHQSNFHVGYCNKDFNNSLNCLKNQTETSLLVLFLKWALLKRLQYCHLKLLLTAFKLIHHPADVTVMIFFHRGFGVLTKRQCIYCIQYIQCKRHWYTFNSGIWIDTTIAETVKAKDE